MVLCHLLHRGIEGFDVHEEGNYIVATKSLINWFPNENIKITWIPPNFPFFELILIIIIFTLIYKYWLTNVSKNNRLYQKTYIPFRQMFLKITDSLKINDAGIQRQFLKFKRDNNNAIPTSLNLDQMQKILFSTADHNFF
jgi:hypothetical protein